MRRSITRLAVSLTVVALAGCSGRDDATPTTISTDTDTSTITTTSPTEVIVEPTVASTTTADPATTVPESTAATAATASIVGDEPDASIVVPVTSAVATAVTRPCDRTDGFLTTPSGRRVLLRAAPITGAAPTILVLHGFTGTPTGIERVADLTGPANAAGIAVAYPEGTALDAGGFGWNSGAGPFAVSGTDDAVALAEMIDAIVATGCVERSRITITGESNGAGMTLTALCSPTLSGAFRSAVMVIPAVDDGVIAPCTSGASPTVPLTAVVGLRDRTAPFDGGNGLLAQRDWFDRIALGARNCVDVAQPQPITEQVVRFAAEGCGACTELFTVADGPHTWPGTREGNGGLTPGTFDLDRRIIADVLAAAPGCLA